MLCYGRRRQHNHINAIPQKTPNLFPAFPYLEDKESCYTGEAQEIRYTGFQFFKDEIITFPAVFDIMVA